MRLPLLRRLDTWVGLPLLAVARAVRGLSRLAGSGGRGPGLGARGPVPGDRMNILILKFFGMGSILLSGPAWKALRARHPGARLTLLTFRSNEPLARAMTVFDEVWTVDPSRPVRMIADAARLAWRLARRRFDAVLDVEFFSNLSALVAWLARARVLAGFASVKHLRSGLYDLRVPFGTQGHVTSSFLEMARALGYEGELPTFDGVLCAPAPLPERLEGLARGAGRDTSAERPVIAVAPEAGELFRHRRWPAENYVRLIGALSETYGARILLLGAPADRAYVCAVDAALPASVDRVNLAGETSVPEILSLLPRVDLYIGNDGGLLHLAGASGAPTVSFFGPESPRLYGPVGDSVALFFQGIPCSPCLNVYNSKESDCRDNICLRTLSFETVWAVLRPRLDRRFEQRREERSFFNDVRRI